MRTLPFLLAFLLAACAQEYSWNGEGTTRFEEDSIDCNLAKNSVDSEFGSILGPAIADNEKLGAWNDCMKSKGWQPQ